MNEWSCGGAVFVDVSMKGGHSAWLCLVGKYMYISARPLWNMKAIMPSFRGTMTWPPCTPQIYSFRHCITVLKRERERKKKKKKKKGGRNKSGLYFSTSFFLLFRWDPCSPLLCLSVFLCEQWITIFPWQLLFLFKPSLQEETIGGHL